MCNDNIHKNENNKNSGCLIFFIVFFFLMFIIGSFIDIEDDKAMEQAIHEEHMNYIYKCADRARNNIENYIDCMNKRPDIR